ncbi:MAG TPA: VWA domain-containing protein [Acidobacteriota bacterium]|nr:VWA domain-containing protein [Acidobacteriota bacterium]
MPVLLAALLILAVALPAPGFAQQAPPRFRVEASFIKVPVTVSDSHGRLIPDLGPRHFRVFDEGEERTIDNFVLDKSPLHVVLLLDMSGSVREELEDIKEAAVSFSKAFDKEDRIAVMSFSDEVDLLQDWTNDPRKIRKSLKKAEAGYRTALFDALAQVGKTRFRGVPGKKAIILLTDGVDNESLTSFDTVLRQLIESDIALYIVSRTRLVLPQIQRETRVEFLNQVMKNILNDDEDFVELYFREKEAAMEHLSESTGGRVLYPRKLSDLKDNYEELARELKTQYLLTFRPPAHSDKRFRHIRVACSQPMAVVRHREQYAWSPPGSIN